MLKVAKFEKVSLQQFENDYLNSFPELNLKNIDLIFIGGGSKLLEKEIKALLPDAQISNTAQLDNVEGFYIIGDANNHER